MIKNVFVLGMPPGQNPMFQFPIVGKFLKSPFGEKPGKQVWAGDILGVTCSIMSYSPYMELLTWWPTKPFQTGRLTSLLKDTLLFVSYSPKVLVRGGRLSVPWWPVLIHGHTLYMGSLHGDQTLWSRQWYLKHTFCHPSYEDVLLSGSWIEPNWMPYVRTYLGHIYSHSLRTEDSGFLRLFRGFCGKAVNLWILLCQLDYLLSSGNSGISGWFVLPGMFTLILQRPPSMISRKWVKMLAKENSIVFCSFKCE